MDASPPCSQDVYSVLSCAGRSAVVRVVPGVEPGIEVASPGQGPRAQVLYLFRAQSVVGEVLVIPPLGAGEAVAQVVEAELEAGMAAAEVFKVGGGAMLGRGVDVDEVADRAAVSERADLGADHVVQRENRTVLGDRGWRPERLLEDVDLALLARGGVGGDEPARQRTGLDVPDAPAALGQAVADRADDLVDGCRVLGGTSKSWESRSTRPWACTAYPPVITSG